MLAMLQDQTGCYSLNEIENLYPPLYEYTEESSSEKFLALYQLSYSAEAKTGFEPATSRSIIEVTHSSPSVFCKGKV